MSSGAQEQPLSPALKSLVETERAFARLSVEKGIREAFLAYFADEGINFAPHPVIIRDAFRNRPATDGQPPVTLNWEPIFAHVSQSGDLGYTTGPYILTDSSPDQRPPQHGYFFSIWKRQADGTWKVVLDAGITTPAPGAARPNLTTMKPARLPRPSSPVNPDDVVSLERELLRRAASGGVAEAFDAFLDEHARLQRNGMFPLAGKEAIGEYLARSSLTLTWQPIKADVSKAGDLAYNYGTYELKEAGSPAGASEKGYYGRVWRRDLEGGWRIVFDTATPIPAERK